MRCLKVQSVKPNTNPLITLIIAVEAAMMVPINAATAPGHPTALAFDHSGNLFVADDGVGAIFKFVADGTKSVFATGIRLSMGNGLAVDASGNLYVLSPSGEYHVGGTIFKFAPDGRRTIFATGVGLPYSLVIDASDNLFVSDWDTGSIFKFIPSGTKSTFATVGTVGTPLAADRAGNLFAADAEKHTIMKFEPSGSSSVFAAGITASVLAVDQAGNLFVGDSENTIFKFTAGGTKSVFGKVTTSLRCIAFDPAGNLFAAVLYTGAIFKFTPEGTKSVFLEGRPEPASDQPEEGADSSAGLAENYAKDYLIASSTISPDRKFAVIYPTRDKEEFPAGANFVVSLKPFAVLGKLDTKWPYFKHESHGGLSADWSKTGSVALVTLDSKWGPGDIFLLEFRDGKLTRTTNLTTKMHDLLLPDYQKAKAKPYNEYFNFIFESEDNPVCKLDGSNRVLINALATTDPKGGRDGRVWEGRLKAIWDIAQAKFTSQKVTRVLAGVRKHEG
jgi:sugar lactone lactonase YvrE